MKVITITDAFVTMAITAGLAQAGAQADNIKIVASALGMLTRALIMLGRECGLEADGMVEIVRAEWAAQNADALEPAEPETTSRGGDA